MTLALQCLAAFGLFILFIWFLMLCMGIAAANGDGRTGHIGAWKR
jgi:hypothetical protein